MICSRRCDFFARVTAAFFSHDFEAVDEELDVVVHLTFLLSSAFCSFPLLSPKIGPPETVFTFFPYLTHIL